MKVRRGREDRLGGRPQPRDRGERATAGRVPGLGIVTAIVTPDLDLGGRPAALRVDRHGGARLLRAHGRARRHRGWPPTWASRRAPRAGCWRRSRRPGCWSAPRRAATGWGCGCSSSGQLAVDRLMLRELAVPVLGELRDLLRETAQLAVPVGTEVLYVDRLEGTGTGTMFHPSPSGAARGTAPARRRRSRPTTRPWRGRSWRRASSGAPRSRSPTRAATSRCCARCGSTGSRRRGRSTRSASPRSRRRSCCAAVNGTVAVAAISVVGTTSRVLGARKVAVVQSVRRAGGDGQRGPAGLRLGVWGRRGSDDAGGRTRTGRLRPLGALSGGRRPGPAHRRAGHRADAGRPARRRRPRGPAPRRRSCPVYQGSPLGGSTRPWPRATELQENAGLTLVPAVNEELGRHRGLGQPDRGARPRPQRRRRDRDLVRQVARRRPRGRRHPPRQLRAAPTRPAGCWCSPATTRPASPRPPVHLRGDAGRARPPGALPRHGAGRPTSAARRGAVARVGLWVGMKIVPTWPTALSRLDADPAHPAVTVPTLEWEGAPWTLTGTTRSSCRRQSSSAEAQMSGPRWAMARASWPRTDQPRRGRRARPVAGASSPAATPSTEVRQALATSASTTTALRRGRHPRAEARHALTARRRQAPPVRHGHADRPRRRGQGGRSSRAAVRDALYGLRRRTRRARASGTPRACRWSRAGRAHRRGRWSSRCAGCSATGSTLAPAAAGARPRCSLPPVAPHAVLLLRLPAQQLDASCPRARSSAAASAATAWSRSPAAPERRGHRRSRRWAARARSGSGRRRSSTSPPVPEHGRRHVLPLRAARRPGARRGRRRHHVQDPLQRRRRHDRRPGRRRARLECRR